MTIITLQQQKRRHKLANVDIVKLGTAKADIQRFIDLVPALYADDPNWVRPLDFERHQFLSPKTNPYFDHAEVAYFVAVLDGKDVGRISAQIDQLALKNNDPHTGHWGLFESIDDLTVAAALFEAAADWLRERGMKKMSGPFSFSVNSECGLLIDGFDTTPMIMMGHAPPYYEALVVKNSHSKIKDLYAYFISRHVPWPERLLKIIKMADRNKSLSIRELDKSRYTEELETIFEIFNDAWADNWGFIPFTKEEVIHSGKELRMLVRSHRAMILEMDGEPAAFMICIPDVNSYIKDLDGKLLPFGWAKFLWRVFRNDESIVRVPLLGIKKEYQSKPIGAIMALKLIYDIRVNVESRGGAHRGELSWILEDNKPMINILDQSGAKIYKTYRLYSKDI